MDGNQVQDQEFNATNRSVPTPDSVGEFRVESGILTADRGRYSGGIISINTQSGGKTYHGRLFEYFRNQALNSNSWTDNSKGVIAKHFTRTTMDFRLGARSRSPRVLRQKPDFLLFRLGRRALHHQ